MHRFLAIVVLFLAGCSATTKQNPQAPAVNFTVSPHLAPHPFVGVGAQMNPYVYCTPNNITPKQAADLEHKIHDLHPQHVRIFFLNNWFDHTTSDPVAKNDPKVRESFLRTAHVAQEAGASINLTLWYDITWKHPEEVLSRFVQIVDDLRNSDHLTAIKYITVQNEPNLHEDKIDIELYNRLYKILDRELRKHHLRDQIEIVAGDLVQDNQQQWYDDLTSKLAGICDGYSNHMYWDYWDTEKMMRRVSEVPEIVSKLSNPKPMYVEEFGVRGHRKPGQEPGLYEDGRQLNDVPLQAIETSWFIIEAINRGYVGLVQWDMYDAWYDRRMGYGVIGDVDHGFPLRPGYFAMKLFTQTSAPGWRAHVVEGDDANVSVACLRGPNGECSVYAINHSAETQNVVVNGLPKYLALRQSAFDGKVRVQATENVNTDGVLKLQIEPWTMRVLSTVAK